MTTDWQIPLVVAISLVAFTGCSTRSISQTSDRVAVETTEIKSALIDAPSIDAASILVEIIDNNLVLSGFVDSEQSRAEALNIADRVSDLVVVDKLKVK